MEQGTAQGQTNRDLNQPIPPAINQEQENYFDFARQSQCATIRSFRTCNPSYAVPDARAAEREFPDLISAFRSIRLADLICPPAARPAHQPQQDSQADYLQACRQRRFQLHRPCWKKETARRARGIGRGRVCRCRNYGNASLARHTASHLHPSAGRGAPLNRPARPASLSPHSPRGVRERESVFGPFLGCGTEKGEKPLLSLTSHSVSAKNH